MKYKYLPVFTLGIILLLFVIGCDSSSDPSETTGLFVVWLTDSPATFDAVNITFSEVSVIPSEGDPIVVSDKIQTLNLIEWSNGNSIPLGVINLEPGTYNQIRLIIDTATVTVDGMESGVKVSSGAQTGLKLTHQFTMEAGSNYDLMIDFDASRSIVNTGSPTNPSYLLKPTIRLIAVGTSGSISGTITNGQHLPVAMAIVDADTISTVFIDASSGKFRLSFLEAGFYDIVVEDTTGARFDSTGVEVNVSADNNIGNKILQ